MSLTLYFLRHGETIYSETGAYRGEVDAELTPEGAQMAEAFAKAVSTAPIGISAYCQDRVHPSQYLSEPELRSRIRRGLLKVEQLHALTRDVFYGRRGRINAYELWEPLNWDRLRQSATLNQSIIGLHCIIHSLPLALKGPSSQ